MGLTNLDFVWTYTPTAKFCAYWTNKTKRTKPPVGAAPHLENGHDIQKDK